MTPFSNNATICSYPFLRDNAMRRGSACRMDQLFARVIRASTWRSTAIGFCVYISGLPESVGVFDAGISNAVTARERFQPARGQGRLAQCAVRDTFVFHAGGVSFQSERECLMANAAEVLRGLHPDYDALVRHFAAADAPAKYRRTVDIAWPGNAWPSA